MGNPTLDEINEIINQLKKERKEHKIGSKEYQSISTEISRWYNYVPESDENVTED